MPQLSARGAARARERPAQPAPASGSAAARPGRLLGALSSLQKPIAGRRAPAAVRGLAARRSISIHASSLTFPLPHRRASRPPPPPLAPCRRPACSAAAGALNPPTAAAPATMPRLGASAVAALLLLAALAPAALAIDNRGPEGPLRIGFDSDEEERVAKQLLNAFTLISLPENSTSHRVTAMAVDPTPPQNISTSHMAQIMGTLLAAAAVDAQAVDTLGDPTKFA